LFVPLAAPIACGGEIAGVSATDSGAVADAAPDGGRDGGSVDGGADASDGAVDSGPGAFPAAHPEAPEILSAGGAVMAAPRVVPVFFPGTGYRDALVAFSQKIAGSTYWKETTGEYGVGPLTAGAPIDLATPAPRATSNEEIQAFLATQFGENAPLGVADPNAIYALYYPASTRIDLQGAQSCREFGAYHLSTLVNGIAIKYAVMPECGGAGGPFGPLENLTIATAHELIEASTDPEPFDAPAYATTSEDHVIWQLVPGSEVTDMCNFNTDAFFAPAEIGFTVARSWSNVAARASHDPCVPAPEGAYFNSVPVFNDRVPLRYQGLPSGAPLGLVAPLGKTVTFDLALFSDGPTGTDWDVAVYDASEFQGGPASVQFSLDRASGSNGDRIHVTATRLRKGTDLNGSELVVVSTLGDKTRFWFGFLSE
jgi:hypothetical protein